MRPLATFAFLALSAAPLAATSYVPVSDEALCDRAAVVAVVRVAAVDSAAGAAGAVAALSVGSPETEVRVEVLQLLKGDLAGGPSGPGAPERRPAGSARVLVPGGTAADGRVLKLWGFPVFSSGERALLFLAPGPAGSFRIAHAMLGAFHEVEAGGRRLALRDLGEALAVRATPSGIKIVPGSDRLRDFDRFARWIAGRARGARPAADYLIDDSGGALRRAAAAQFTLFHAPEDGHPMRWFDFDSGKSVQWKAYFAGEQGLAGGGFAESQTALAAWTGAGDTNVSYLYGGTTTSTHGLYVADGVNSILFNNPDDPMGKLPSYDCDSGGALAIGGAYYDPSQLESYQGRPTIRLPRPTSSSTAASVASSPPAPTPARRRRSSSRTSSATRSASAIPAATATRS